MTMEPAIHNFLILTLCFFYLCVSVSLWFNSLEL